MGAGIAFAYALHGLTVQPGSLWIVAIAAAVALFAASAIKVADQWDRAVILRLGKFRALKGPGLFGIIPIIDTVPYWVDTRVIPTSFKAEKTLTKDTVPVDVDAVLFWQVVDVEKATLNVAEYLPAISWASQTALRDVIGKTLLADMLEGRHKISGELQKIIDDRTEPWGIRVPWKSRMSSFRQHSRTPCRCRRRPKGSVRLASFSVIPSDRSLRNSRKQLRRIRTIQQPCT